MRWNGSGDLGGAKLVGFAGDHDALPVGIGPGEQVLAVLPAGGVHLVLAVLEEAALDQALQGALHRADVELDLVVDQQLRGDIPCGEPGPGSAVTIDLTAGATVVAVVVVDNADPVLDGFEDQAVVGLIEDRELVRTVGAVDVWGNGLVHEKHAQVSGR